MKPGLAKQKNFVVVPHIASASKVIMQTLHVYKSRNDREKMKLYVYNPIIGSMFSRWSNWLKSK